MAPIQWSTLICDGNGVIDHKRVRSLLVMVLAVGGAVPLILSMLGIRVGPDTGHMALGAAVLVTPITAGRVTEAVLSWRRPALAPGEV